jgi:molybdopterin/thiamine biosynthesis adenylyltransferase/nitroreductase
MLETINSLKERSGSMNLVYSPVFFRSNSTSDKKSLEELIFAKQVSFVHDEIYGQLQELLKSKNPSVRIKSDAYNELIENHLQGIDLKDYGVWVYYPWNQRLVHMLDHDEFIEVRTNRNQYKITRSERDKLGTKKVGIIGLSVGQSIALTLTMERGYGELRLADFDILELSNLNRIRAGVHNLGIPKVVVTAREIAEIDPFLKVSCFFDGLTVTNMDEFFTKNGKLDILIDECDGLDMKIISRYKARELRIPVLMDTSDRGMIDIERFDIEPERPILHGTVQGIDPESIKELSHEDKVPIVLQMLGVDNISLRAKASMIEVEQTINTWPQLASSVTLGGAAGADICRRILLDQFHESGRYYIDFDDLIADKKKPLPHALRPNPYSLLTLPEMKSLVKPANSISNTEGRINPSEEIIQQLVHAACAAPSTGNDQPWKWLYINGTLYLYHEEQRSFSFGDYKKIASFLTFGAAYENLYIHALKLGIEPYYDFLPNPSSEKLVASIYFKELKNNQAIEFLLPLNEAIFKRQTNRNQGPRSLLSQEIFEQLTTYSESIPGAKFRIFTDENVIKSIGRVIGACDRTRLLNPEGHFDFVHREMRWEPNDAKYTRDGVDIRTLGLPNAQLAALGILKDENVIRTLKELKGGKALDLLSIRTVSTASALCMITLPKFQLLDFFEGGRAMERFWLAATNLGLAVHPLISPFYLFPRITHGNGEGLDEESVKELTALRKEFTSLTNLEESQAEVFLTKIAIAEEPTIKTYRLPLEDVLTIN